LKFLIVNADDLGMTPGVNAGVIEAHQRGVVTSASLMVKQPAAEEAARLAAANPRLGLGLHIDLAECELGRKLYARVDVGDQAAVATEIEEQLALFVSLVGREPDHLDSHQHAHFSGPVRAEALRLAITLRIPLRNLDPRIAFCGDFYGQKGEQPSPERISLAHLLQLVEEMPDGWTELMCHPGRAIDVRSVYARERETELAVLCDPGLPKALAERGVEPRSFIDSCHGDLTN
jgi:predicted glycoside hydrolase/deacetylase ChbG (UPF0249 family)